MVGFVNTPRPPIAGRPAPRSTTEEPADKEVLQRLIASVAYLRLFSHMAHFNVTGPSFYSDHKTYETVYESLNEWIDTIGERITALGYPVDICPECLVECIVFEPCSDGAVQDAQGLCMGVLSRLEAISGFITASFRQVDDTTANMMQELCLGIDKLIYFVRRGFKAS